MASIMTQQEQPAIVLGDRRSIMHVFHDLFACCGFVRTHCLLDFILVSTRQKVVCGHWLFIYVGD